MSQPTTQSTAGPLLKELLTIPPVRAINDRSWLHDKLTKEQATMDFSGKYARYPVTLRRAIGAGSRADGGTLPGAAPEETQDAKVYMKQHYFAIEWSEALEEATKNQEGAFEKVITTKVRNGAIDMAKGLNRQLYNRPYGALANTTNSAAGLTHAIDDTQFINVGDFIDIVAPTTGLAIANGVHRQVKSVDRTNYTITLDTAGGNVDPAGTEIIVIAGNYGNEIDGLRAVASTGRVLYGIDSTNYTNWDGKYLDASGGSGVPAVAGESLFERGYDKVGRRAAGDIDTWVITRGMRRRLADEMASQRRYLDEKPAERIELGYKIISINGVETVVDDDCPRGNGLGFKRDTLKVLKMTDPSWMESSEGGGAMVELKNTVNSSGVATGERDAVFQSWYRYHMTLCATDPGLTVRIGNADDDKDDE